MCSHFCSLFFCACVIFYVGRFGEKFPCALPRMRSLTLWSTNTPSYEPKFFDDYHFSETTEIFIQESSSDSRPSNLHGSEISDCTIGRALSSPLFQEREDAASRRRAYHSQDEGLSSVGHDRTETVLITNSKRQRKFRVAAQKMSKSGFFWNDKESRISLIVKQRFENTNSRPIYDRRSIQKLSEMIESQGGEIYRAHQGDDQLRRDQLLLHEQLL